jgi:hypothetical protein
MHEAYSWVAAEAGRPDNPMVLISMSDGPNGASMKFCDADACGSCGLTEGAPDCLRRKANFCFWLVNRFARGSLGAALHKMGLNLIKDADALEKEAEALSGRDRAAAS